jgi:hypothetical protein
MIKTNFLCSFGKEIHGLHLKGVSVENISSQLSPWATALFEFLPPFIRKQVHARSHSIPLSESIEQLFFNIK